MGRPVLTGYICVTGSKRASLLWLQLYDLVLSRCIPHPTARHSPLSHAPINENYDVQAEKRHYFLKSHSSTDISQFFN